MLTNPMKNTALLCTLAICFSVPSIHAASVADNPSPYQLQIATAKMTPITERTPALNAISQTHIYQLEYKYRTQPKPLKVKAAMPEKTPPLGTLSVSVADNIAIKHHSVLSLNEAPFSNEIELAAHATSLDPSLVHAVIYVESRYQHSAVSPKGAVGLMQVMPDTAARYGLRDAVYLPKGNIKAGTLYLRDLMAMFDNRIELVLAAYNAGEGAVKKYAGQIPPYPETRHYVKAVMAKYALNTGNNEWKTPSDNDAMNNDDINHDTQMLEPLTATQTHTHYLTGTALVIPNNAFTFSR